jgi:hypothetical protein
MKARIGTSLGPAHSSNSFAARRGVKRGLQLGTWPRSVATRSSPARTRSTPAELAAEPADPDCRGSSLPGRAGVEVAGILVGGEALALLSRRADRGSE